MLQVGLLMGGQMRFKSVPRLRPFRFNLARARYGCKICSSGDIAVVRHLNLITHLYFLYRNCGGVVCQGSSQNSEEHLGENPTRAKNDTPKHPRRRAAWAILSLDISW